MVFTNVLATFSPIPIGKGHWILSLPPLQQVLHPAKQFSDSLLTGSPTTPKYGLYCNREFPFFAEYPFIFAAPLLNFPLAFYSCPVNPFPFPPSPHIPSLFLLLRSSAIQTMPRDELMRFKGGLYAIYM